MDYLVKIDNSREFAVKNVVGVSLQEGSYFLYNEEGEVLLTVPQDKVSYIGSTVIKEG